MVTLGLLLIALVCLIVGLVLPNTAWLLASLIASAGAGYLLWRSRGSMRAAHAGGGSTATAQRSPAPNEGFAGDDSADDDAAGDAAAGDDAAGDAAAAPASDDEREPAGAVVAVAEPVVGDSVAETLTIAPAPSPDVTETTQFAAISDVTHDEPSKPAPISAESSQATPSPAAAPAAPSADDGDVWVIDGRPRYHLAHCAIIQGQDAEPIPLEQATEDGFMPCSLCEPNAVRAG